MKLIDTNILLYAVDRDATHHRRVRKWLEAAIAGDEPIGLTWLALLGFLRLATRSRVFQQPLTVEAAASLVDGWLAHPNVYLVLESDDHWRHLRHVLLEIGTVGNLTSDAHLVSLAIANGASVASCDSDFARFRQIRWENPLA